MKLFIAACLLAVSLAQTGDDPMSETTELPWDPGSDGMPTHEPTLEPVHLCQAEGAQVIYVEFVAEGLTEENMDETCGAIADALSGSVCHCSFSGPSNFRRNLETTQILYMTILVPDACAAQQTAREDTFLDNVLFSPDIDPLSIVTSSNACDPSCVSNDDCDNDAFCEYDETGTSGECTPCDEIESCANHIWEWWQSCIMCLVVCEVPDLQQDDPIIATPTKPITPQVVAGDIGELYCEGDTPGFCIGFEAEGYDEDCFEGPKCAVGSEYGSLEGECIIEATNQDGPCTFALLDAMGNAVDVAGKCIDMRCVYVSNDHECPDDVPNIVNRPMASCTPHELTIGDDSGFTGSVCAGLGYPECEHIERQQNFACCSKSFKSTGSEFIVYLYDQKELIPSDSEFGTAVSEIVGRCVLGKEDPNCAIQTSGFYEYNEQEITYVTGETEEAYTTILLIPYQTGTLTPVLSCPEGQECEGTLSCEMEGDLPCDQDARTCEHTQSPTVEPTQRITAHGDPIVWTFNDECYDLNKDGIYSATKHPMFDHEVKIIVYNDFMREIQILNDWGEIVLSINNLGDVLHDKRKWPYQFSEEVKACPYDMKPTECYGSYIQYEFDAQSFHYTIYLLRHDYLDPALEEGELGYHLDIWPQPYTSFSLLKDEFTGLYFENPLPDLLEYCPGGSIREPGH